MTSIEARIWSTKMADNQHFRYINKLPCFKEIYGNWKRCLKAYSYTRKEHWTWSTNMAAMASKFNFECVIQYYTDQWFKLAIIIRDTPRRFCFRGGGWWCDCRVLFDRRFNLPTISIMLICLPTTSRHKRCFTTRYAKVGDVTPLPYITPRRTVCSWLRCK